MEISQKKLSNHHTFIFEDEHFNFAVRNKSGTDDFDLNYANFPRKSSLSIEQNEWLRNVGILWCLLGSYNVGTALFKGLPLTGTGFWLLIGLICLIWFSLTKVKYSVFKTDNGNVFVIKDSNHDKIISEIEQRKKAQLLKWYGEINFENELKNEINKFNWLVEQKVITQTEAKDKIAQAELAYAEPNTNPHELN